MTPFDPIELLRVLSEHHVDFVVIGGFAAWMQGSPALTTDVAGARVRFATLEAVLDMKTQAGRPKDLLGIANIKAAIEARSADEGDD